MNNLDAKIFAAQLNKDIATLDLHGLFPIDALEKLEIFLFDNYEKNNEKILRIIYGGGTGKLGEKVREYLEKHGLVKRVIKEHGNCLVVI